MTAGNHRATAEGGANPIPRPPRAAEIAASLDFLDRLAEAVAFRLDRLEALAAELGTEDGAAAYEREHALRERLAILEATQARQLAAASRREEEWQSFLFELESERGRLAEAWERVEAERTDASQRGTPSPRARPTAAPDHADPPAAQGHEPGEPAERMTREVLKQFQALRGDVRRNAAP